MIVRYEKSSDTSILIINECNKYLGEIEIIDFAECMEDKDSFEEDEYNWFFVNKEKINLCFQSFPAKNDY